MSLHEPGRIAPARSTRMESRELSIDYPYVPNRAMIDEQLRTARFGGTPLVNVETTNFGLGVYWLHPLSRSLSCSSLRVSSN